MVEYVCWDTFFFDEFFDLTFAISRLSMIFQGFQRDDYKIERLFRSITNSSSSNNRDFVGSRLRLGAVSQEALAEVGFGHDCSNKK